MVCDDGKPTDHKAEESLSCLVVERRKRLDREKMRQDMPGVANRVFDASPALVKANVG
ncbi:hypothetical protein Pve01_81700 [Planomonospora venezuelensis]|nr:hypothetical protein Pve01_81700 [Planomonospora venezuelensis]